MHLSRPAGRCLPFWHSTMPTLARMLPCPSNSLHQAATLQPGFAQWCPSSSPCTPFSCLSWMFMLAAWGGLVCSLTSPTPESSTLSSSRSMPNDKRKRMTLSPRIHWNVQKSKRPQSAGLYVCTRGRERGRECVYVSVCSCEREQLQVVQ